MNRKVWISVATALVAAAVAIAVAFQFRRPAADHRQNPQPPLKLSVGMSWAPGNANIFIAKQMGYFSDAGLDLGLERYPSGQLALADTLKAKLDLAVVAETPVVFAALRGERFYLLATTYESNDVSVMIARRDRGIAQPSDLPGKRLGTVFGTNGEFVQDTILAMNNIDPQSIARVDLAPARAVDIVAQALGLEEALVKDAVNAPALTVALNHSLIIAMEDQARWAIKRGLVDATAVPDFLKWIDADALAAVKPEAVSMIK